MVRGFRYQSTFKAPADRGALNVGRRFFGYAQNDRKKTPADRGVLKVGRRFFGYAQNDRKKTPPDRGALNQMPFFPEIIPIYNMVYIII
ncbi:MAG: hypothetical protein LUD27_04425 [Clostridia bacterium]|nr:hypothetical protein [Clostridia bacterium]